MFIEILFKMLLFKGGVLIYAEHCIYIYIYIYIYIVQYYYFTVYQSNKNKFETSFKPFLNDCFELNNNLT